MGVTAEIDVDYGRIYGPFPTVGHIPKSHFIGYLTSDEKHDSGNVKINLNDGYLGNTWLPYVQPARTMDEQNMEAYMKDGHIFYRALRIIRANEELLVWYSKDFAQILDIPFTLASGQRNDDEPLICPTCGERFKYIYSLMAHSRFRCHKSPAASPKADVNIEDAGNQSASDVIVPPMLNMPTKRKHSADTDDGTNKAFVVDLSEENNNNNKSPSSEHSPRTKDKTGDRDIGSAFRKVEKTCASRQLHGERDCASVPDNKGDPIEDARLNFNKSQPSIARHLYKPTVSMADQMGNRFRDGLGMLMSNWALPTSLTSPLPTSAPTPAVARHMYIQQSLYANNVRMAAMGKSRYPSIVSPSEHDSVRRLPGDDVLSKHIFMEQIRKSQLPCVPAANPMVEKLLQTASTPALLQRPVQPLNLAQNWCAKCNATFRMTSDLVYHMRSHHKREFDPIKKKRDDKLQCDVCKETFKERHHLTRHMTSHT